MKKLFILAFALMIPVMFTGCGMHDIDYGSVGVKVNKFGGERGVDDEQYSPGIVLFNPLTEAIFEFPVYQQTVTWTQSSTEGSPNDDSVTFQSMESATCNADVYIAYEFNKNKIGYIVRKHKKSADDITNTYVRSMIRDEFNNVAGTMRAIDIAGPMKGLLSKTVKNNLNKRLYKEGIHINEISLVGQIRLDSGIQRSINTAVKATQDAIAAENKKRQIQAIADQKVIKALGDKAAIEANPYYMQQMIIEKWDGHLPKIVGSATSFNDVTKYVK